MARLDPLDRTEMKGFEANRITIENARDIVPNSLLMGSRFDFTGPVFGEVTSWLKHLIARFASLVSGCQYCATHNTVAGCAN